jgi:hypothetical protein
VDDAYLIQRWGREGKEGTALPDSQAKQRRDYWTRIQNQIFETTLVFPTHFITPILNKQAFMPFKQASKAFSSNREPAKVTQNIQHP